MASPADIKKASLPAEPLSKMDLLPAQRERLVRVWHRARRWAALSFTLVGLILSVLWGWSEGYVIAAFGAIASVDSALQLRRTPVRPATLSMLLDITMISAGMALAWVPDSAIGLPFGYVILASLMLLPARTAVPLLVYGGIWFFLTVQGLVYRGDPLSDAQVITVGFLADITFAAFFLAMVAILTQSINRHLMRNDRQLEMERALAACSTALLDRTTSDPVPTALAALMRATEASAAYVDINVDDPELGLCAQSVAVIVAEETELDPSPHWDIVPWSKLPGRDLLEAGESHEYRIADLDDAHREEYAGTDTESELKMPIVMDSEWFGVVGLTDLPNDYPRHKGVRRMLGTAAGLFAAYYQRERSRQALEATVDALDKRARYQHALAECSSALLGTYSERAVDNALAMLLRATEADYAYVDKNYHDPDLGLCARLIHEVEAQEPGDGVVVQGSWRGGPYSDLPTAYAALSQGRPVDIASSDLEGREREKYEDDGIRAELCLPINVAGEWVGSIGFAERGIERKWTNDEVQTLRAAAEMIGAFWEGQGARRRLEDIVESLDTRLRYEEAIAACSTALLMSDDESAIDVALVALLDASGAHDVFVDRNIEDPEHGVCAVVTHEAIKPGYEAIVDPEIWIDPHTGEQQRTVFSYDLVPKLAARLAAGKPAVVDIAALADGARTTYESDGCFTELNIPVFVAGEWVGAVAFADYESSRRWEPEEVSLLQTAAGMFGAFWERNEARDRLRGLVRAKDDFLAAVSHEIRTPLTTVVGLAHELSGQPVHVETSERRELLQLLAEQSDEVSDIVDDLLVAARADNDSLVITNEVVDLRELTEHVVRSSRRELAPRIRVEGADVLAIADSSRVRQILRNLVVNADRYGGDRIRVQVFQRKGVAGVAVWDDGDGIPPERIDHVFEPYQSAHDPGSQPASVGLGLAVSRQLARLMGGDVIYRKDQGWSVFEATFTGAEPALLDGSAPAPRISMRRAAG